MVPLRDSSLLMALMCVQAQGGLLCLLRLFWPIHLRIPSVHVLRGGNGHPIDDSGIVAVQFAFLSSSFAIDRPFWRPS